MFVIVIFPSQQLCLDKDMAHYLKRGKSLKITWLSFRTRVKYS